jgi:hypothetical protein
MREGTPLPGTTPPDVVSQLTHRVLGPIRRDRVAAVLDFHGLADRPAGTRAAVAARHGVGPATLKVWTDRVAAAGARLPLPPTVVTAALRRSRPDQDHLSRTRIAATLGLAAPPPAVLLTPVRPARRSPVAVETARAAIDVLSTVGPLELDDLLAAVSRQRRIRGRDPLDSKEFEAALQRAGAAADGTGRWVAPPGRQPTERYRAIATAARGRELTRGDLIEVLIDAGYTPASAQGISARHPLFRWVGPNRYRLVGDHPDNFG